ncbi:MAG: riboflavin synthase [Micavibrio sp.]|nr:riboflavin synthase [Micavibrio sp.]|tara:strand:+ start:2957 stop:3556 length:600 start_codon:yes stop_codon:yes gene_type:complete
MFTGLVRDIGVIDSVENRDGGEKRITVSTGMPYDSYTASASVCCSGICLTVTRADIGHFQVDVSRETLSKTNISMWTEGSQINLEPSLRMGDELGGHLVFGHVDTQAVIKSIKEDGESWRISLEVDDEYSGFIAQKGSIALNGISLTVNEVEGNVFGVNIIPYTWDHTTLSGNKEGDKVNLEVDMLARYVARALEAQKK